MSARPSGSEPTRKSTRAPAAGVSGPGNHPPRLNLGCGTLVVLFLLIATAGKFLPHQGRDTPISPKPERVPAPKPVKRVQPPAEPSAPKPVAKPAPSAKATVSETLPKSQEPGPKPVTAPPKVAEKAWPDVLSSLLTELEQRVKPEAKPSSREAAKPSPIKPAAPKVEPPTPKPDSTKPSVASSKPRATMATAEPGRERTPAKTSAEPETRVWEPPGGAKTPAGKAKVINSPWDQSVEQVLFYLKRHIHAADSLEVIEWGKVKPSERGYQVRCKYRSKNVLGQYATQDRLFVLDQDGVVTDVRD
jgi:hypothetical protein